MVRVTQVELAGLCERASCDERTVLRGLVGLPIAGLAGTRVAHAIAPLLATSGLGRVRSEVAEMGNGHEEPALLHVLAAVLAIIDREIGKATL
jgi:hypothetical protein